MSQVERAVLATPPDAAQIAFFARYQENVDAGFWNETLATLLNHRSVRSFTGEPLPEGLLETLVAAASSAPTSSNLQAWSVVAVTDPERKRRLSEFAGNQQHIIDAPLLLAWVADLARIDAVAGANDQKLEGLDYTESFLLATIDAALAAQNALVAAESLGLGGVYIGALRNHPVEVARLLALPPKAFVVFGLVVGVPDIAVPATVKPRLPQQVVLHRETYNAATRDAGVARHDEVTTAFRIGQGLPVQTWSALAIDRLRTVAALKGRDKLRQTLASLGFALK